MGVRAVTASALRRARALPAALLASGNPDVAALQVGLRAHGLYAGTVDGVLGAGTEKALRRFQRRAGLAADGVPGPRDSQGARPLRPPSAAREAAARARLARLGRRRSPVRARLARISLRSLRRRISASHTDRALRRFQRWAGLAPDGAAGPTTYAALRRPLPRSPIRLAWPLTAPLGDPFGPRGNRFHAGIDLPAPTGTPVAAAGSGRVVFAGLSGSGWGRMVLVAHGNGVRTRYAHLSRIAVHVGERVATGSTLGRVGATGEATGPHLHFEVLMRGANVDPLSAL